MNVVQRLTARLPDSIQIGLGDLMMRLGWIRRVPLFRFFLRSLAFFGAEPSDLERALAEARDLGPSFVAVWRRLAAEQLAAARAAEARGERSAAALAYRRACLDHQIADWAEREPERHPDFGRAALAAFEGYRRLAVPAVESVRIPYRHTHLAAHLRLPAGAPAGSPPPVVVIFQGNDETKEWMVPFEEAALARGLATLSVDQPGFGESGLDGTRLTCREDAALAARACLDLLARRRDVDGARAGAFGVSLGGFYAPFSAALEPRFRAVAGIGGPYDLHRALADVAATQRRRVYAWSGAKSREEFERMIGELDVPATFGRLACPALIVHGAADEVVDPDHARRMAAAIGPGAELWVVEGGDHLCTHVLASTVVPRVFDWFAARLGAPAAIAAIAPEHGGAGAALA